MHWDVLAKSYATHTRFYEVTDDYWLEQASQWHEMYCHDLEVMSSNPSLLELGVRSTFILLK